MIEVPLKGLGSGVKVNHHEFWIPIDCEILSGEERNPAERDRASHLGRVQGVGSGSQGLG